MSVDGIFVVRVAPTGKWDANCCSERCEDWAYSHGLHNIAECDTEQEAKRAAAAHRRALRARKEPAPPEPEHDHDQELERLRKMVEQARALHSRDDSSRFGPWCGVCMTAWPCKTRRILAAPLALAAAPTSSSPDPEVLDGTGETQEARDG